jgi:hypothetical protein
MLRFATHWKRHVIAVAAAGLLLFVAASSSTPTASAQSPWINVVYGPLAQYSSLNNYWSGYYGGYNGYYGGYNSYCGFYCGYNNYGYYGGLYNYPYYNAGYNYPTYTATTSAINYQTPVSTSPGTNLSAGWLYCTQPGGGPVWVQYGQSTVGLLC